MKREQVETRLLEVHARLVRARQELAVAEEQLDVFLESAEETRYGPLCLRLRLLTENGKTLRGMPKR